MTRGGRREKGKRGERGDVFWEGKNLLLPPAAELKTTDDWTSRKRTSSRHCRTIYVFVISCRCNKTGQHTEPKETKLEPRTRLLAIYGWLTVRHACASYDSDAFHHSARCSVCFLPRKRNKITIAKWPAKAPQAMHADGNLVCYRQESTPFQCNSVDEIAASRPTYGSYLLSGDILVFTRLPC